MRLITKYDKTYNAYTPKIKLTDSDTNQGVAIVLYADLLYL